jgi:hypothetical protein
MDLENKDRSEDKIGISEIHETFWRARDFELTNLWQRSIFLTAFLVLCFTAYGVVISKIADNLKISDQLIFLNIVGYLLSIMGAIFSILWIKMGKGSKAWYEIYEGAIRAFETNQKYARESASAIGGFNYRKLEGYYRHNDLKNNLFSLSAGAYSVSKINIAIGQAFLAIWIILGLIHIVLASILSFQTYSNCFISICVFLGLMVIFIIIIALLSNVKRFKSGSIDDFYPPPAPK